MSLWMSFENIKAGDFDGPKLHAMIYNKKFSTNMNDKKKNCKASICGSAFLVVKNADKYEFFVVSILSDFGDLECNMGVKFLCLSNRTNIW